MRLTQKTLRLMPFVVCGKSWSRSAGWKCDSRFKKLTPEDRARFKGAMVKERLNWLNLRILRTENKVTTIVKAKRWPCTNHWQPLGPDMEE